MCPSVVRASRSAKYISTAGWAQREVVRSAGVRYSWVLYVVRFGAPHLLGDVMTQKE